MTTKPTKPAAPPKPDLPERERAIKSHVVSTSASTSGGQRFMRVSLTAAPWEEGE